MAAKKNPRPIRTLGEYIERYLPDDAKKLERLEIDPAGMGEQTGRRAIERALAGLTSSALATEHPLPREREPQRQANEEPT